MTKEKCILCGKETVSVIKTDTGFMCYNCYADQRNPPRSKEVHNNEEARIQTEFFKLIPLYFPNIPGKKESEKTKKPQLTVTSGSSFSSRQLGH